MDNSLPRRAAANPTQYNIDAIAKLEQDALRRRTLTERVSDIITKLVGNMGFLLAHVVLISGWILVNLHVIPGLRAFDPFPFGVLASPSLPPAESEYESELLLARSRLMEGCMTYELR